MRNFLTSMIWTLMLAGCGAGKQPNKVVILTGAERKPMPGVEVSMSYVSSTSYPKAKTDAKGEADFKGYSWDFHSCHMDLAPFGVSVHAVTRGYGAYPRPLVILWPALVFERAGDSPTLCFKDLSGHPMAKIEIFEVKKDAAPEIVGETDQAGTFVLKDLAAKNKEYIAISEGLTTTVDLSSWAGPEMTAVITMPAIQAASSKGKE